jgi:hypothetical protein
MRCATDVPKRYFLSREMPTLPLERAAASIEWSLVTSYCAFGSN